MTNTKDKTQVLPKVDETVATEEETEKKRRILPLWLKSKKGRLCVASVACALVVAGGAIAIASNQPTPASSLSDNVGTKTEQSAKGNTNTDGTENTEASTTDANDAEGSATNPDGTPATTGESSTLSTTGDTSNTSTPASNNSSSSTHTHTWTTIEHPAVTHTEDVYTSQIVGSHIVCLKHGCTKTSRYCPADPDCMANESRVYDYGNVKTGTKTVTDQAAYSEKICSTCGAKG